MGVFAWCWVSVPVDARLDIAIDVTGMRVTEALLAGWKIA